MPSAGQFVLNGEGKFVVDSQGRWRIFDEAGNCDPCCGVCTGGYPSSVDLLSDTWTLENAATNLYNPSNLSFQPMDIHGVGAASFSNMTTRAQSAACIWSTILQQPGTGWNQIVVRWSIAVDSGNWVQNQFDARQSSQMRILLGDVLGFHNDHGASPYFQQLLRRNLLNPSQKIIYVGPGISTPYQYFVNYVAGAEYTAIITNPGQFPDVYPHTLNGAGSGGAETGLGIEPTTCDMRAAILFFFPNISAGATIDLRLANLEIEIL